MSLAEAQELLALITRWIPPPEGLNHGMILWSGKLVLTVNTGPGYSFKFEAVDLVKSPRQLADEMIAGVTSQVTESGPAWREGEETMGYVFCESVHATGTSPWHIRKLGKAGLMLGGGIDTASLCNVVKPMQDGGSGGWDLRVRITDHHLQHCCRDCGEAYRRDQLAEERAR